MKKINRFLATVATACCLFSVPAFADDFAIVVNAANSTSGDGVESEIKNLYLRKKTQWNGGAKAVPLARAANSPEQQAFLSTILQMSQSDLESHWASEKSKAGTKGPRGVDSTNTLLRQIGRREGAFSVISATEATSLPKGVKILKMF